MDLTLPKKAPAKASRNNQRPSGKKASSRDHQRSHNSQSSPSSSHHTLLKPKSREGLPDIHVLLSYESAPTSINQHNKTSSFSRRSQLHNPYFPPPFFDFPKDPYPSAAKETETLADEFKEPLGLDTQRKSLSIREDARELVLKHKELEQILHEVNSNNGNTETDLENDDQLSGPSCVTLEDEIILDFRDPEFYIAIDRDYSGKEGMIATKFTRNFPIELKDAIPREAFEYTIDQVNAFFDDAEQINCKNTLESMLSYLTCTLINICRKNQMEKALQKVGEFLYDINDKVYHPAGLHVVHPMCRGLRTIDIRSISSYPLYHYVDADVQTKAVS